MHAKQPLGNGCRRHSAQTITISLDGHSEWRKLRFSAKWKLARYRCTIPSQKIKKSYKFSALPLPLFILFHETHSKAAINLALGKILFHYEKVILWETQYLFRLGTSTLSKMQRRRSFKYYWLISSRSQGSRSLHPCYIRPKIYQGDMTFSRSFPSEKYGWPAGSTEFKQHCDSEGNDLSRKRNWRRDDVRRTYLAQRRSNEKNIFYIFFVDMIRKGSVLQWQIYYVLK